ncbi:hypothetical protein COO60DRAFT_1457873 [Scenedesmus sp. NREL 46B-D3]|nr:hypothetical protein COO60DRAFT_1457873 [Scenedesmus sp. NREL 46B-D3]
MGTDADSISDLLVLLRASKLKGRGAKNMSAAAQGMQKTQTAVAAPVSILLRTAAALTKMTAAAAALPGVATSCRNKATAAPSCSAAGAGAACAEEAEQDDEQLCVVCWAGLRSVAMVHGGTAHLCLCAGCVQLYDYAVKGCPICRQPVQQTLKDAECREQA